MTAAAGSAEASALDATVSVTYSARVVDALRARIARVREFCEAEGLTEVLAILDEKE
jgi:hypothetical protein